MGVLNFSRLLFFGIIAYAQANYDNINSTNTNDVEIKHSAILSRTKRFLVFPEGSSFQIVFCTTFPMNVQIGDIFLVGYTAALAYTLPQDPYSPFDHHGDPLHRRMDTKTIYYTDDEGKVLYKRKYDKKPLINPAMAKRSIDYSGIAQESRVDRKLVHASQHKREFLKSENMDQRSVEFHRSSRVALYEKLETLLRGLGSNGRECILKTLCLVGQTKDQPQGLFLQEILRAVFTLPKGVTEEEYYKAYDEAHSSTKSCEELYPDCSEPVADPSMAAFTS